MLKFLGSGSAFNIELGNNSAFLKDEKKILILDCGGTVFEQIRKLDLLEGVDDIYVFISHTHPDHIGSLGDLIFYAYYILKRKVTIIHLESEKIVNILSLLGVKEEYYNLISDTEVKLNDFNELKLNIISTSHSESLKAYSLILSYKGKKIYYSGDSNSIDKMILEKFKSREIELIYQDTCGIDYVGNGHLYIEKLCNLIDVKLRKFVYCMHLDTHIESSEITKLGFNIATRDR